MIPAGYMIKRVSARPDWLKVNNVQDIYSVSNCVSSDFMEYINYWRHNGYWLFNSLEIARQFAHENHVNLDNTKHFYYEIYEREFSDDQMQWRIFGPTKEFTTQVAIPQTKTLEGYDVVSFSLGNKAEYSPLSCNHLATEIQANCHCLLETFEQAYAALESGKFLDSEPGPFRVFAVYTINGT
jgi:hypothetical protein